MIAESNEVCGICILNGNVKRNKLLFIELMLDEKFHDMKSLGFHLFYLELF